MKLSKALLAFALCFMLFLSFAADIQSQELQLQKITSHLYMVSGGGGNVAFLVTEEGVLVIDAKTYPYQAEELLAKIKEITDKPIKYLIFTHYHADHTWGAQSLPAAKVTVSHINTRKNMEKFGLPQIEEYTTKIFPQQIKELEQKIEKLEAEKSPKLEEAEKELAQTKKQFEEFKQLKLVLPDLTFKKKAVMHICCQKVKLLYMGNGHTDGDTIVYFPDEKAIHMGDLLFIDMIPYIDRDAGSNTENWIKILNKVAEMDVEKVIPGHGEITDNKGLLAQIEYLKTLRAEVEKFIKQGASLKETKEKLKLPKYEKMGYYERFFPINVEAVYKEMTEKEKSQ